ncbi:MAG: hypothetical protein FWC20_04460 [Oscillospiraceae bacterium]|nr:hypothetical protein [Oscillospiraceae bacterium]MCL2278645.1 hypothetical protein [Oscillospiraceae bacterium]
MNVGLTNTKFVKVFSPNIRFDFSDKAVFADGVTTDKRHVYDKERGELEYGDSGEPVFEYIESRWKLCFVGAASESAKGLHGKLIDIDVGWIEQQKWQSKADGKEKADLIVKISEFSLSGITSEHAENNEHD